MIGITNKQSKFTDAVNYNANKAEILLTNCAGRTKREITAEFDAVAAGKPAVLKPARHTSLSLAEGDSVTDREMSEIVTYFQNALGATSRWTQFCAWRHHDTPHAHVHIVSNRVTPTLQVLDDRYDFFKIQNICRQIEKHFDLKQCKSSWEIPPGLRRRHLSAQERKTGILTLGSRIAQAVDLILDSNSGPLNFQQFSELLEFNGVRVSLNQRPEGRPYLLYEIDGKVMRGYAVSIACSISGLLDRNVQLPIDPEWAKKLGHDHSAANDCYACDLVRYAV